MSDERDGGSSGRVPWHEAFVHAWTSGHQDQHDSLLQLIDHGGDVLWGPHAFFGATSDRVAAARALTSGGADMPLA
jgi:hypothetical protein